MIYYSVTKTVLEVNANEICEFCAENEKEMQMLSTNLLFFL